MKIKKKNFFLLNKGKQTELQFKKTQKQKHFLNVSTNAKSLQFKS